MTTETESRQAQGLEARDRPDDMEVALQQLPESVREESLLGEQDAQARGRGSPRRLRSLARPVTKLAQGGRRRHGEPLR